MANVSEACGRESFWNGTACLPCSLPQNSYQEVVCPCTPTKDAIIGCKPGRDSPFCPPRVPALLECLSRGGSAMSTSISRPGAMATEASTRASWLSTLYSSAAGQELRTSAVARSALENASTISNLKPEASLPVGYIVVATLIPVAVFGLLAVVVFLCIRRRLPKKGPALEEKAEAQGLLDMKGAPENETPKTVKVVLVDRGTASDTNGAHPLRYSQHITLVLNQNGAVNTTVLHTDSINQLITGSKPEGGTNEPVILGADTPGSSNAGDNQSVDSRQDNDQTNEGYPGDDQVTDYQFHNHNTGDSSWNGGTAGARTQDFSSITMPRYNGDQDEGISGLDVGCEQPGTVAKISGTEVSAALDTEPALTKCEPIPAADETQDLSMMQSQPPPDDVSLGLGLTGRDANAHRCHS